MRRRGKPFHPADLQRHHHAQDPAYIWQRLQQIRFGRDFHQRLESLLNVRELHFQKIQRHQFQFHTLPGVFWQLSQAFAEALPALHTKQVAYPGNLHVVTRQGPLNPILQPRSAAPKTYAAAATLAGPAVPPVESILPVGSRCAAECLSRWHLLCRSSCRFCPSASWLPAGELNVDGARLPPSRPPSSNSARPLPMRFASLPAATPKTDDIAPDHVLLGSRAKLRPVRSPSRKPNISCEHRTR